MKTDKGEESVSGTVFFKGQSGSYVVGGYTMDMIPEGYVIVSRHLDKPGVIGRASTILGKCNINIAGMQVGRINPGEEAIMVLNWTAKFPQRDGRDPWPCPDLSPPSLPGYLQRKYNVFSSAGKRSVLT